MVSTETMLVPGPWVGPVKQVTHLDFLWLKDLPKNTFCALWLGWPGNNKLSLPPGYDFYVVSFYLEAIDVDWVKRQSEILDAPILLLSDCKVYNTISKNVFPFQFYHWHKQIQKIKHWFPIPQPKRYQYKTSAFCNRVTQSKLLIFTALAEYLGSDSLLKLDTRVEEKNVHFRQTTGIKELDDLADIFWTKYVGNSYRIDDFENSKNNIQTFTADPYSRAYTDSVLNFTNESFHYSYYSNNNEEFIFPGPFLTEKTLKCLVGSTPFIPVGQFETFKELTKLGFKFEYGDLDLSWDSDPGNLTRLLEIIKLIKDLQNYTIQDIVTITQESTQHNFDHVHSDTFADVCESHNKLVIEKLIKEFK